ncbi:hypothetical protein FA15DRAFT_671832 [Coprinopsis marcescibilis]|uniref:F-box domain-containing protein n=1 Tax=Coprinopsis marcescibilis TaxID=230819 RepID=A0A5C3KPA4_COPMA|nr:hypothetical protein FA15DRAFT_671832 [Coprinopsis marcescibilis]
MTISQRIPPEIWDTIARYLPGHELAALMGVNRTFMQHAMKEKYRQVYLATITRREQGKLESIRDNDWIAELVLEAHIGPEISFASPILPPLAHPPAFQTVVKTLAIDTYQKLRGKDVVKSSRQVAMKLVCDVLARLKNVTKMSVVYAQVETNSHVGWRVWDPDSRSPSFPLDLDFPQLTELYIRTTLYQVGTGITVPDTPPIARFINKFQKTLTRLSVLQHGSNVNLQPLWDSLGYFPNLVSIDIAYGIGYTKFIKRYTNSLRELQIPLWHLSRGGVGAIEFRKLEKVTLIFDFPEWSPGLSWWSGPFVKSILKTVKNLIILPMCSAEEFTTFISNVTAISESQAPPMEKLSISLNLFAADTIPSIASAFPRLRSLKINFAAFTPEYPPYCFPTQSFPFAENAVKNISFAKQMAIALSGVSWDLEDISIKCRPSMGTELISWGLMHICGEFIPSISSFNSTGSTLIPNDIQIPRDYVDTLWMH